MILSHGHWDHDWVVRELVAVNPAVIVPAHCTGYRVAYAIYQRRPDTFIQNTVGTRITLTAAYGVHGRPQRVEDTRAGYHPCAYPPRVPVRM